MRPTKYIALLGLVLFFAACKEDNPGVILEKPLVNFSDTTYLATPETPKTKSVLIEDFTGVRCANCPKGHHAIEKIRTKFPGKVSALSIHGQDFFQFTTPYSGYEDFRGPYGEQIFQIIGKPGGLPFGAIDRVHKSSTADNWETLVSDRFTAPGKVNLYIDRQYDDATRTLSVKVKAAFTDSLGTAPFFSVGITESGIISLQKDEEIANDPVKQGLDTNYVHNHLLRTMPAFKQNLLPQGIILPEAGRVVEKTFSVVLPKEWNAEKCDIVFYVHRDLEILNVVETKVK